MRFMGISIILILPYVEKISWMCSLMTFLVSRPRKTLVGLGVGLLRRRSLPSFFGDFDFERERRLLLCRWRLGLGEDDEDEEEEERELEEPEWLEAEELEPLEEPELEPELLLLELELDLLLLLEALRRVRFLSRPRLLSAPSLVAPDLSLVRCLLLSSSFLFVGEGAIFPREIGRAHV